MSALVFLGIQTRRLGQQTRELRRQNDAEAAARREDEVRRRVQAEQETAERHLSQARLIAAFMGPAEPSAEGWEQGRTAVDLVNGSDEPVYRLVVAIVFIQGAAPHTIQQWLELRQRTQNEGTPVSPEMWQAVTTVAILPKGTYRLWFPGTGWSGILSGRNGAEVAFTDRAGSHWIRRATGAIEEIDQEPFEYFKRWDLYGPYDLRTPERLD